MSDKPTSLMKRRLNVFVALALVLFTVWIIINLATVSIKEGEKYQQIANSQQFQARVIYANRGNILDRNGNILATSATVYTVFIDPVMVKENDIKKLDLICEKLSEILGMSKDDIRAKAAKSSRYEFLKRKVDKTVADKVNAFIKEEKLSCIGVDPDTQRIYPHNDLAASVIGFTNYDGNGIYGLEKYYDEYLSGINGKIISAKDGRGADMPYRYEQNFPASDGNTLVLNIDLVLQYYVEKELKRAVEEHGANNRACAIIMNVKTGQILAMATEPDFDLNNPTEIYDPKVAATINAILDPEEKQKATAVAWEQQWKNKAITELYNPGSVFKVITGSSALEEKVISMTDVFTCTGSIKVGGETFHCWSNKAHGPQTFVEAMTNSCNPAFVEIGQRLGVHLFSEYFSAYGLDKRTGIDLPGESGSIYHSEDTMTVVDLAASSFGQSNKITPLQMITAYAAVVNGGELVTPYVVNKIVDKDGNVVKQFEPQIKRQVISEETSKLMRETLETVVVTNGGSNAYIQGYRIGGKSGTSQKIDEYGEAGRQIYVSSYVGFAPANDPEIIMLVMVDEPSNGKYYGSLVASPVVSNVFKEALPYLGYFPEYTAEEYSNMDISIPDVVGAESAKAKSTLEAIGLTVDVVGSGANVIKQVPASGSTMPRTGKVILYTEETGSEQLVTVPNVLNMSLQEANIAITNAGLNFKPVGGAANHSGAFAYAQNYNGVLVPKYTVVEVTFVANDETG